MSSIEQKLERLTLTLEKYINLQEQGLSDWLEPDAACRLLGFKPTESGSHRRRLKVLMKRGFLTNVRYGKPNLYDREQIVLISKKMKEGTIII